MRQRIVKRDHHHHQGVILSGSMSVLRKAAVNLLGPRCVTTLQGDERSASVSQLVLKQPRVVAVLVNDYNCKYEAAARILPQQFQGTSLRNW